MKLEIVRLTLGPLLNNVYLLGDHETDQAVVIDPSFESQAVLDRAISGRMATERNLVNARPF